MGSKYKIILADRKRGIKRTIMLQNKRGRRLETFIMFSFCYQVAYISVAEWWKTFHFRANFKKKIMAANNLGLSLKDFLSEAVPLQKRLK